MEYLFVNLLLDKKSKMKKLFSKIMVNWAIHSFVAWVVINLFTMTTYIYHINRNGYYIVNEDKTPVDAWQYFVMTCFQYNTFVVVLFLLLVEINYHCFFTKLKWYFFTASSLFISILSVIILSFHHQEIIKKNGILSVTEPIIVMLAYAIVYAMIREYFYQVKHKRKLQIQQTEHELNTLKSQLNSHFLFNCLNYLYGTALKEKAITTADAIDQLSDLLRYTINGMHANFVPLEDEVAFINNYLSLQKARTPEKENITIDIDIDVIESGWKIAPLLMLTFIENAFKYGISMDESCNITIKLNVKKGHLTLLVANKIFERYNAKEGNNTGVKSTIKRLQLLYPDRFTFENFNTATDYKILLQIQLNK